MLRIYPVMLEVMRAMRPVLAEIERHDRDLARQVRRAAASVVLNIAEGSGSRGGTRRERYLNALGSAKEVRAGVESAEAFGYVHSMDTAVAAGLRQVIGTLVRVTA